MHNQDFKAGIVVKMRMTRGHDQFVVLVLQLGQIFANAVKGGWKVSPYAHGVGQYYDSTSKNGRAKFGPYGVLNMKVEKALLQNAKSSTVLYADLNNLTNRRYTMPWQFRDPGFNILGGFDFRF